MMSDTRIQSNALRTEEQEQIQPRRWFIRKVYLLVSLFVVVGILQWLLIAALVNQGPSIGYFISLFGLLTLASCLIIFLCFPSILMKFPVNWIFIGVIVEAFIVVMLMCVELAPIAFFVVITIVTIAMAALVVMASKMACDLTKGEVCLNMIAFFMLVVFVVLRVTYSFIVPAEILAISSYILMLALVLVFTMYYVQLIQGGRYIEMELNQVPFAALLLFCNLMMVNMMLMGIYFHMAELETI